MRSVNAIDGCLGGHLVALNPATTREGSKLLHHIQDSLRVHSMRNKSTQNDNPQNQSRQALAQTLLSYGLPGTDLIEPHIEPFLRSVDFVETLASAYRKIDVCPQFEKYRAYLEQCALFHGLSDAKLFRRSLRSTRQHAVDVHTKVVLASWLKYERREDELIGTSSMDCCGRNIECPKANLVSGYDPESAFDSCICIRTPRAMDDVGDEECSTSEEQGGVSFCIGEDVVSCVRSKFASLSVPLKTMLYGEFRESRREIINFSQNGFSVKGLRAAETFSRTRKLTLFEPDVVVELLSFSNRFCCDEMKSACDSYLASLVQDVDDALLLIEYGLEEMAHLLVAACLQVISLPKVLFYNILMVDRSCHSLQVLLREMPSSMHNPNVIKLFCSVETRKRLALAGNASFALYYLLSQVAMEQDMKSNTTVMLLERLVECATDSWERQLGFHQLGVVMLERKEYEDAEHWFQAAVEAGHLYSQLGAARSKYKRGHKYQAYKLMNSLISDHNPTGWMHQERSLYCEGKEKMMDLDTATQLDPTLTYPYKYRAVLLLEENKTGAAISEINKIIRFKASADCLELRAWFFIALEDYEGALRDVRALLTLDPNYMMFHGKMSGDRLVQLLQPHVQQWSQADCWMQLYDLWSSVDDIGSLAVVHHMLQKDPGRSLLRFRQSLLLLR